MKLHTIHLPIQMQHKRAELHMYIHDKSSNSFILGIRSFQVKHRKYASKILGQEVQQWTFRLIRHHCAVKRKKLYALQKINLPSNTQTLTGSRRNLSICLALVLIDISNTFCPNSTTRPPRMLGSIWNKWKNSILDWL